MKKRNIILYGDTVRYTAVSSSKVLCGTERYCAVHVEQKGPRVVISLQFESIVQYSTVVTSIQMRHTWHHR